ncbi:hypothetical protein ACFLZ5_00615 [Thermodesulfobacteriota bacterium]
MYYVWCPECNLTARCSKDETGDYYEYYDYCCKCDAQFVGWEVIQLFFPELPKHPLINQKYMFTEINTSFTPLISLFFQHGLDIVGSSQWEQLIS